MAVKFSSSITWIVNGIYWTGAPLLYLPNPNIEMKNRCDGREKDCPV